MLVLTVEYNSVEAAAQAVSTIGAALDGAPGGAALRLVAVSLPGSELAAAAVGEASEWAGEMADAAATFERYAAALKAAMEDYRRCDAEAAAAGRGCAVR